MKRPLRLAWASPLPPSSSGIADYSAELLPILAERSEVTLFHDDREGPRVAAEIATRFPCRSLATLGPESSGEFDLVLYQIGNSAPHHATIFRKALAVPGVVVLHETMLHHLVREMTLARGDSRGYVDAMRYATGRSGELAAQRLLDTHFPVDVWSFPLFEQLVDRSLGVIVHSEFARQRVLASRPLAEVHRIPMGVAVVDPGVDPEEERATVRQRLGIDGDEFVVASFGFVTPQKRLEPALAAFARLRRDRQRCRFVVVGEVSPHYDFAEVLARHEADGVTVLGRVPAAAFSDWMQACDLAVNLRHPTGGETSASLLRLLALGRPTVVNSTGAFTEVPEGAVIQLPLDGYEEATLSEIFVRVAGSPDLARAIGAAARAFVAAGHTLRASVDGYLAACGRLLATPMVPLEPCPPLLAWPADDPWPALLAAVGAEVADLGIGESDEEALREIAARLAELR
ncbi:MAG: glycosyltransferase family 4 protein [Thermoanaerobaculia bacterium]